MLQHSPQKEHDRRSRAERVSPAPGWEPAHFRVSHIAEIPASFRAIFGNGHELDLLLLDELCSCLRFFPIRIPLTRQGRQHRLNPQLAATEIGTD